MWKTIKKYSNYENEDLNHAQAHNQNKLFFNSSISYAGLNPHIEFFSIYVNLQLIFKDTQNLLHPFPDTYLSCKLLTAFLKNK